MIAIRIILFVCALLTWLLLSWSLDLQHLVIGVIIGIFVSCMTADIFTPLEISFLTGFTGKPQVFKKASRYLWFLLYIPLFIWECIKANIDGAIRVLHPDLPINPGIVKVKTTLTSDAGLTFLANTLTLKPGTMTVDVDRENGFLYVHWVDVKEQDIDKATHLIVEKFERILKRIFE